jgi:hypothetical protein
MDRITDNTVIPPQDLNLCDVFVYHNPEWLSFCSEPYLDAYDAVLASVSDQAIKIGLPLPQFHPFWPFHTNDPRNADSVKYPYGDAYVLELMRQGLPPEEVISRYMTLEFSSCLDLDRLLSSTITHMRRNERNSLIKIADYIEQNFRDHDLFTTVNHASNKLLLHMTNEILRILDCEQIPEDILSRLDVLVGTQSPVHPAIARHFGVGYIDENTRFTIEQGRDTKFSEYIREYVYFA